MQIISEKIDAIEAELKAIEWKLFCLKYEFEDASYRKEYLILNLAVHRAGKAAEELGWRIKAVNAI